MTKLAPPSGDFRNGTPFLLPNGNAFIPNRDGNGYTYNPYTGALEQTDISLPSGANRALLPGGYLVSVEKKSVAVLRVTIYDLLRNEHPEQVDQKSFGVPEKSGHPSVFYDHGYLGVLYKNGDYTDSISIKTIPFKRENTARISVGDTSEDQAFDSLAPNDGDVYRLADGRVLRVGREAGSPTPLAAQVFEFDPDSGTWSGEAVSLPLQPTSTPYTVACGGDGGIYITGPAPTSADFDGTAIMRLSYGGLSSKLIKDPFSFLPDVSQTLPTGEILMASDQGDVRIFNPHDDSHRSITLPSSKNYFQVNGATLLTTGKVLLTGIDITPPSDLIGGAVVLDFGYDNALPERVCMHPVFNGA